MPVNYLCRAAEVLLMSKPPGYFLIRVSESRIGYTLSYRYAVCAVICLFTSDTSPVVPDKVRPSSAFAWIESASSLSAEDRCRHFMIDASDDGQCVIVGEDRRHRCLHDLVEFHQRAPIVPFNEVLTVACGQVSHQEKTQQLVAIIGARFVQMTSIASRHVVFLAPTKTSSEGSDYADLLFPQRQSNHQASLQPVDSSHQGLTHQSSQEDAPPALPYLPSSLNTFAAVTPVSQPHRLYPGLPEYPPATTSVTASVMIIRIDGLFSFFSSPVLPANLSWTLF